MNSRENIFMLQKIRTQAFNTFTRKKQFLYLNSRLETRNKQKKIGYFPVDLNVGVKIF